jgi:hypothetical protein
MLYMLLSIMFLRIIIALYITLTTVHCTPCHTADRLIVKQFRDKLSQAIKMRDQAVAAGLAQNFDNMINQTSILIDQLEADLALQEQIASKSQKNTNLLIAQLMQVTHDNIEIIQRTLDNLLLISSKDAIYDAIFAFERLSPVPGQKAAALSKTSSRKGRKTRSVLSGKKRRRYEQDITPIPHNHGPSTSYQSISLPEEQYLN